MCYLGRSLAQLLMASPSSSPTVNPPEILFESYLSKTSPLEKLFVVRIFGACIRYICCYVFVCMYMCVSVCACVCVRVRLSLQFFALSLKHSMCGLGPHIVQYDAGLCRGLSICI